MVSEEIKMVKKSSHIQTTDKQTTPSYKLMRWLLVLKVILNCHGLKIMYNVSLDILELKYVFRKAGV
jgi:hypothetical protein